MHIHSVPDLTVSIKIAGRFFVAPHTGAWIGLFSQPPFPCNGENMREQGNFAICSHLCSPGIPVLSNDLRGDCIYGGLVKALAQLFELFEVVLLSARFFAGDDPFLVAVKNLTHIPRNNRWILVFKFGPL